MPDRPRIPSLLFAVPAWCMAGLALVAVLAWICHGTFSGVCIGSGGFKQGEGLGDLPLPTVSSLHGGLWLPWWFIAVCCVILAWALRWGSRRAAPTKPAEITPQVAVCLAAAGMSFVSLLVLVFWILPADAQTGFALLLFAPVCAMPATALIGFLRPFHTPMPIGAVASAGGIALPALLSNGLSLSGIAATSFFFVWVAVGALLGGGIGEAMRRIILDQPSSMHNGRYPDGDHAPSADVAGPNPEREESP